MASPYRLLAGCLLLAMAGCAQVHTKSIATAPGEMQAFELRSRSWSELEVQAAKLCPHGHAVLRSSQGSARLEGERLPVLREYQKAMDFLGVGSAHGAQAWVQCKAAAASAKP